MRRQSSLRDVAEGVGFEPTVPFSTAVFKTAALNHSATPPPDWSITGLRRVGGVSKRSSGPPSRLLLPLESSFRVDRKFAVRLGDFEALHELVGSEDPIDFSGSESRRNLSRSMIPGGIESDPGGLLGLRWLRSQRTTRYQRAEENEPSKCHETSAPGIRLIPPMCEAGGPGRVPHSAILQKQ